MASCDYSLIHSVILFQDDVTGSEITVLNMWFVDNEFETSQAMYV
jgi:hypothetical protein